LGLGGVARDGQAMFGVVVPVEVADVERGLVDGCLERHGNEVEWGAFDYTAAAARMTPDFPAPIVFSHHRPGSAMSFFASLKQRARAIRADALALYFAARHPGTPWYAKLAAVLIVAYAFSPVDLVPDFIP